jgi:hypothetical protein
MAETSTAIFAFCFLGVVLLFVVLDAVLKRYVGPYFVSRFVKGGGGNVLRIGVVGSSAAGVDEARGARAICACYDRLSRAAEVAGAQVEIVSGLTVLGVPKLAYQEAARRGWKTAGIACAKARDHPCFPCDRVRIVGAEWGDESAAFLRDIDCLVRIGSGGPQAKAEYDRFTGLKLWYDLDAEDPTKPVEVLNSEEDADPRKTK